MNKSAYEFALEFKKKHPFTVAWRIKQNASVVDHHVNSDERVLYAFAAQKNNNPFNIWGTAVVAITNKRILIGRKRVVIGYFLNSVTPDLFNDLKVTSGIFWGKIYIDTVKEFIALSNISKDALDEIETEISTYMMEEKKQYAINQNNSEGNI